MFRPIFLRIEDLVYCDIHVITACTAKYITKLKKNTPLKSLVKWHDIWWTHTCKSWWPCQCIYQRWVLSQDFQQSLGYFSQEFHAIWSTSSVTHAPSVSQQGRQTVDSNPFFDESKVKKKQERSNVYSKLIYTPFPANASRHLTASHYRFKEGYKGENPLLKHDVLRAERPCVRVGVSTENRSACTNSKWWRFE